MAAALVVALFSYFPLGRRAAQVELARASSEAELPGVYYSRASAGFDDTLVSFGDDDDDMRAEAAWEALEKAAENGGTQQEDDEEIRTFGDPAMLL